MKKFLFALISSILLFGVIPVLASASSDTVVLISQSKTAVIEVPENVTAQENYAALSLQKYLKKITGKTLDIVKYSDSFDGSAFCVGNVKGDAVFSEGQYKITEADGKVYIVGGGLRGTIYGVYGFLEKYCDCHWYAADVEVVPQSNTVSIPKNLEYDYTPYFEYTETDWRCGLNPTVKVANGTNGGVYFPLSYEMGDSIKYISNFCHTLATQFCSRNSYFESHPEYFALVKGKRASDQLCLTNPEVLRIVKDEVLDLCKRKHDPSQALQIISLTQDDNQNYCTCDKCKALDEKNGSHSGSMITFVNEVAKEVKKAGYDNIAIDTFAYQYTRQAPTNVVPEKNVIVRLCSIECCFGHTLDDPKCKENTAFMKDLSDWAKLSDRLYIWDYTTNYSETYNIFPDFGTLQRNMQIFYENHAKGIYEEGAYYINSCDGEFADLRSFLLLKLMQNPYVDYSSEMNGFLKAYYGDGWESVREFIDICTEKGVNYKTHLGIYQEAKKSLPDMKSADIKRCDELWQNAENLAQDDFTLMNVKRSELCWRYWKCANRKSEFGFFTPLIKRMALQEELYNDITASGGTCLGEGTRERNFSECRSMILLRIPIKWSTRYEDWFWRLIDPVIVNLYNYFA